MRGLIDTEVKALLKKYSIIPSKKRGQSFLTNNQIARKIIDRAELKPADSVLEIGGGLGILSELLAANAKHLFIIEIDAGLVGALRDLLQEFENVTIIQGDALVETLPKVNKIVSNLPYSISSEVTFRLLKELNFDQAILMFQKEYAKRLVAGPCTPEYSRLTIGVSYLSEIELLFDVGARNFYPIPAVDSSVVRLRPRKTGLFAKDTDLFFTMIRGIYSYPNKQLRKALRIWFKQTDNGKELVDSLLTRVSDKVSENERLRCLNLDVLIHISDELSKMIGEGEISIPRHSN